MKIVNPRSLAATLDALNEAFFEGRALSKSRRQEAAKWIAGRSSMPGSYRGMPAPTAKDFRGGFTVFTGEKFKSRAGTACKLGHEAWRALVLLDAPLPVVRKAIRGASEGMGDRLRKSARPATGMYCCGSCSVAAWRALAAGVLPEAQRLLAAGMKALKARRDGSGRWKAFPFYYTLLALSDIDLPEARAEKRYARPACEPLVRRFPKEDKFDQRRRLLAERILNQC